jgi:hypothetical protein
MSNTTTEKKPTRPALTIEDGVRILYTLKMNVDLMKQNDAYQIEDPESYRIDLDDSRRALAAFEEYRKREQAYLASLFETYERV